MDYITIVILGIVQGITEFLPISSDGHLVIVAELLKLWRPQQAQGLSSVAVIVALHIGTLMSILVVMRRQVLDLCKRRQLIVAVVLATIPLVIIGKPLKDLFEQWEKQAIFPLLAGIGLCITSVLMSLCRRYETGSRTLQEVTSRDAILIGVFQAFAPLPGVSRSGSTIFAGLTRGLSREAAAQFSFLIAIPAILGAVVLHARDMLKLTSTGGEDLSVLGVGVLVSFLVGLVALKWLLKIVAKGQLKWFAWYCLIVGVSVIIWQTVVLSSK